MLQTKPIEKSFIILKHILINLEHALYEVSYLVGYLNQFGHISVSKSLNTDRIYWINFVDYDLHEQRAEISCKHELVIDNSKSINHFMFDKLISAKGWPRHRH